MKYKWNIEFENAGLIYPNGKEALKNINLRINEGEMVAIIGLSGAGKTTLLKTINKLQNITSGELYVGDRSDKAINHYKQIKEKFNNEKQKLESFSEKHILTEKIVKSFSGDLLKRVKGLSLAIEKRKKIIQKIESQIDSLTLKFDAQVKKYDSKGIAAPYAIQIRDKKSELRKEKNKLAKRERLYLRLVAKNKINLEYTNNWQNNIEEINKQLTKRLKERVSFSKKEYQKARISKPFYSVKKISGKIDRIYKSNIGMVFQRYNLIYKSSVLNNALSGRLSKMPWWRAISGIWSKEDKQRAFKALADVNILEVAYSRAEDLSGGQMQRVALARTITQGARLFLADEPVGALDPIMAKSVMDSFLDINQKTGKTVIMNLHHVDLALTYADRIIGVKEGQIVYDGSSTKVDLNILKKIYGNKLEGFDAHELSEIMRKRKKVKG